MNIGDNIIDIDNTIGLLTAASMKTMAIASRSSSAIMGEQGRGEEIIHVDAIVTAGLSNSRSAGADADYFVCCESRRSGNSSSSSTASSSSGGGGRNDETTPTSSSSSSSSSLPSSSPSQYQEQQQTLLGTINTIVIVSGPPLTPAAQIEAYAIAIEAKCASCVNLGVLCAKDPTNYGMGTGTDCCVLISPCIPTTTATTTTTTHHIATRCRCGGGCSGEGEERVIKHAGKHTLFAEMIGQAVQEATTEAIMINIRHLHYNYATYTLRRWMRILLATTMKGARPSSYSPRHPMMSVPGPPLLTKNLGVCFVFATYYFLPLSESGKLLLAAVIWDKYLGEPPLRVHPVCLVGSMINLCLSATTTSHLSLRVYTNPVLGFTCGLVLLISTLVIFLYGAWKYTQFADFLFLLAREVEIYNSSMMMMMLWMVVKHALVIMSRILKILLLKSTVSLQLLCTVALNMAHYLERGQIDEARTQLAWLCSRDASELGSSDLAGATLESLSENLSDGFIAPIFWYVLLGPMGALGYRIINTLDSRIGYRGKYEWFGKTSARLDDLVNFVPARLTALLLALAAGPVRGWTRSSLGLRTAWKDVEQCDSPNAGWPMACFAGVLDVRLVKEGAYCLGAGGKNPGSVDIRVGHIVAQIAGVISILFGIVVSSITKH